MSTSPNIVLVHGAWADGSCWSAVIERLQADGYNVTAPQFPETSLADDVARLRHVLNLQDGPTVVAGHSYGGQIMTALGTDAPNAVGLVYIAAFGLDEGESIGALLQQGPPTPALAHLDIDDQGFAWLPEDDFVNHFAADVDPVKARVMHAVQQPLAASTLEDVMGVPPGNRCRPGSWSPTATRRSRPTPSASSPSAWARPPSKSRPTTSRWSPTPTRSPSSSRPPPTRWPSTARPRTPNPDPEARPQGADAYGVPAGSSSGRPSRSRCPTRRTGQPTGTATLGCTPRSRSWGPE